MTRLAQRPPDALVQIVPDRWTSPYWDAAKENRLTCAQCATCGRFRMPPTPYCPGCLSQKVDWPTLPGTGTIYSFTIVERAIVPGTEGTIPYVPAVVDLDAASPARIITNIVDSDVTAIAIGRVVQVVFDHLPDGSAIPRFTLKDAS